jgi:hypothetical protein
MREVFGTRTSAPNPTIMSDNPIRSYWSANRNDLMRSRRVAPPNIYFSNYLT